MLLHRSAKRRGVFQGGSAVTLKSALNKRLEADGRRQQGLCFPSPPAHKLPCLKLETLVWSDDTEDRTFNSSVAHIARVSWQYTWPI